METSHWPLTTEDQVSPCEISGGKVTLGQVFSEFFCFSLSVSFHCGFPYTHIIWEKKNRATGGHNSKTVSRHQHEIIIIIIIISADYLFINHV
jgi:hypothetical protein